MALIEEKDAATLMVQWLDREIGKLMQQAQHWHEEGVPLAVHHRINKADNYYQIKCMLEGFGSGKDNNPFEMMRKDLSRPPIKPPGAYPASSELYEKYHDPRNVVKTLQARINAGLKWY